MSESPDTTYRVTLPYPPSVNTYWRMFVMGKSPRMILSKDGRDYQKSAGLSWLRAGHPKLRGRFSLLIIAFMPDRRTRDLDNICKAVLDGLTHANAIDDDSQIDDLRVLRGKVDPGNPRVEIALTIIKPEFQPALIGGVA